MSLVDGDNLITVSMDGTLISRTVTLSNATTAPTMVTAVAVSRTHRYANKAQGVAFNPVGQIVGTMNDTRPCRELIQQMAEEYVDAVERLDRLMPTD